MWKSPLITGGTGRLGVELKKYFPGNYPTHEEFDITRFMGAPDCDLVVHMAGYTDVNRAETEPHECFRVNVKGTYRLAEAYRYTPFVFISSEHAGASGTYFDSKLIGEKIVENLCNRHLIIRTLFKPNPWPWDYAFKDQITQGDYVDVIAPLIAKVIKYWSGSPDKLIVGTGKKTMFELAKQTKPDVKPNSIKDVRPPRPDYYYAF